MRRRSTAWPAAALAVSLVVCGCAVNPVTGERELALISESQEVTMGRTSAEQVVSEVGLVDDAQLQAYVSRVGTALARRSERPELPWEFHIVDDSVANAFALPGGFIFVTRGLMDLLTSEAQLAAVLGHEIGHVTARHSVSQLSRAQLAQLGLGIGMAIAPKLVRLGGLTDTALSLLFLKYSRDDESQADQLGFRYMLANGYDVREMDDVFTALQASSRLAGSSPMPSWLSSHPSEPDRIEAARRRVAALGALPPGLKVERIAYLRRIDGMVYGSDPRHGYFDDGMFYAPELAFGFKVPADWRRQNLKAAVTAQSPSQDAALRLSLSSGSPEEASARFFAQQGVMQLASSRSTINGYDAIVSRFAAESGSIEGRVAHLGREGKTYELVTYAAAPVVDRYAELFADIIDSFATVTDPEILGVRPQRIDIVELDRDMTLGEFARRYPSKVSVEELAVLNQLEGPSSKVSRGALLKRVVS